MTRLENWAFVGRNPYASPEMQQYGLKGFVYNHPRGIFKDGDEIITSAISHLNEHGQIVTKSGTVYELGEIDPEYEKMYPNAKERLLDRIPIITGDGIAIPGVA